MDTLTISRHLQLLTLFAKVYFLPVAIVFPVVLFTCFVLKRNTKWLFFDLLFLLPPFMTWYFLLIVLSTGKSFGNWGEGYIYGSISCLIFIFGTITNRTKLKSRAVVTVITMLLCMIAIVLIYINIPAWPE